MLSVLQAIVLGLVQGLTEFIPVSSSGHLVLVPYLLSWPEPSLDFTVALHAGTLLAVLLYFRHDLWAVTRGVLGIDRTQGGLTYKRLAWWLVLATVPVVVIGLVWRDEVEGAFASPVRTAVELVATGLLLVATEVVRTRRVRRAADRGAQEPITVAASPGAARAAVAGTALSEGPAADAAGTGDLGTDPADPLGLDLRRVGARQSLAMGLLQALALLPGISRSGATIAGGVWAGLTRQAATRFSFLLSIPALVGAIVLSAPDLAGGGGGDPLALAAGVLAAFASGYLAIRVFLRLVATQRLTPFAWYCVAAAAVSLLAYAINGPAGTA